MLPKKKIILSDELDRGIADLFPNSQNEDPDQNITLRFQQSIDSKRPLRVKLGIDPTGKDIHLGHTILFRKLRAFQDAGHIAVLIIGDFTARIGDPTGKSKTRVQLNQDEVDKNAINYLNQLGKGKSKDYSLLDFVTPGRLEIRRNSEWLEKLDLTKIIEIMSNSTVGQMLAKEDFATRYSNGTSIALHEFLYPLLQGYDSVAIEADIELGGTDQKFNVAIGRDLQNSFNQRQQFGLLMPILTGIDGIQKMSKSLNNIVSINDGPLSMYSKLEKIPDHLVEDYLTLLTNLNIEDIPSNPRERQKAMALAVTETFHGAESAKSAQLNAANLVAGLNHSIDNVPEISVSEVNFPSKLFFLLSKLEIFSSSSEARRQIQGGAVRIDGERITDPNIQFLTKSQVLKKIIQVGKKRFYRLID
tara:strand:+ start:5008 stop:6258 length:1251 start_codon:yes stop_codon:yes gene_type:complete